MEIEEGGLWGKEQKNVTEGNSEKKVARWFVS